MIIVALPIRMIHDQLLQIMLIEIFNSDTNTFDGVIWIVPPSFRLWLGMAAVVDLDSRVYGVNNWVLGNPLLSILTWFFHSMPA